MDKFKRFNWRHPLSSMTHKQKQKLLWDLVAVMTVVLFALAAYLFVLLLQPPEVTVGGRPVSDLVDESLPYPTDSEGTELRMLEHLIPWYRENNALVGWLRIDGTKIDYPVIHTPEDEDKYLRKNFNGKFSMEGTLIVGAVCSTMPESDNIIIYGHNMRSGTMFHDLMNFTKESYWEEHPVIEYSTLFEERQYEIFAAFYDRIYDKNEKVFKFYQFANYDDEEEFLDAMVYFKGRSEYETGVVPVYGDRLLTLVTCSYHESKGRFVVVAREILDEVLPET